MSLYHPKRYKVSFVESAEATDIMANRLALGDENVQFYSGIDDKSSWFEPVIPDRRNRPHLAAALPVAP
jgi:hypothetical protein